MRKKIFQVICCSFFLLVSKISFSQEKLQQEINVFFTRHDVKDSLISSKPSTGNGINTSYAITRAGIKRKTVVSVGYEQTHFKNEFETIKQDKISVDLSDGFNIASKQHKQFAAYLGYSINTSPSYITGYAAKNNYQWNSSLLLSLYQSYRCSWNKQAVSLDIKIPVAGTVYRPQSKNVDKTDKNFSTVMNSIYSNPSFSSLYNYYTVDIMLKYQVQLSNHFAVSAGYHFNYVKWKGDNRFSDKINASGLSLIYR